MKITPKFKQLSGVTIELTVEEVRLIGMNATENSESYTCNMLIRVISQLAKEHDL